MTTDPLLDLLDHPPQDAATPPDPVFTARVMERLQHANQTAALTRSNPLAWWLGAAAMLIAGCLLPTTALTGNDVGDLASSVSPELLIEFVACAPLAAIVLLCARKWAV